MAVDGTKCRWGSPGPSGTAKQCGRGPVNTFQVQAADRQAPESIGLCKMHTEFLTARSFGTVYREDGQGNGVPMVVELVD